MNRKIFRGDQLEKSEEIVLKDIHVLNEIVVDRGPSPYAVELNVYIDGNLITKTLGDGVIIATPTGSTAYNLASGGSILQTHAQNILLTPLAAHSLSFRPLILTPDACIKVEKVKNNRNSAWVSLDGANRIKLEDGESIEITGSANALKMVTLHSDNLTDLWAQRLTKYFGWNTAVTSSKPLQKNSTYGKSFEDSPTKDPTSPKDGPPNPLEAQKKI